MQFSKRTDRQKEVKRFGHDTLQELRIRRASPMPDARDAYDELKGHVLQVLAAGVDHKLEQGKKEASRTLIHQRLDELLAEENIILTRNEKRRLSEDVTAELLGFGLKDPTITIKRAVTPFYTVQELCDLKTLSNEIADFLHAAVTARLNVIITGLAGTGKTTFLRALCSFIPTEERIVTIEEMAELHLDQDHVIPMKTRLATGDGKTGISAETLIMTTSRIRPDRLILGSIQGREAFAWLQVINAGLTGSMTTCNAESAQDSLARIELMALLGDPMLPQHLIRSQITSAVDLIVHLERLSDNSLKAVSISEAAGFEDDHFATNKIFQFEQTGLEDGQIAGTLQSTGDHSHCAQRIRDAGIPLPPSLRI